MEAENTKYVADKVFEVFGEISKKVGSGVDHFWPEYCKFTMATGISTLIAVSFAFIFMLFVLNYILKNKDKWSEEGRIVSSVFGLIITGIAAILFFVNLSIQIPKIIAPEGAALSDVIEKVYPAKR